MSAAGRPANHKCVKEEQNEYNGPRARDKRITTHKDTFEENISIAHSPAKHGFVSFAIDGNSARILCFKK